MWCCRPLATSHGPSSGQYPFTNDQVGKEHSVRHHKTWLMNRAAAVHTASVTLLKLQQAPSWIQWKTTLLRLMIMQIEPCWAKSKLQRFPLPNLRNAVTALCGLHAADAATMATKEDARRNARPSEISSISLVTIMTSRPTNSQAPSHHLNTAQQDAGLSRRGRSGQPWATAETIQINNCLLKVME